MNNFLSRAFLKTIKQSASNSWSVMTTMTMTQYLYGHKHPQQNASKLNIGAYEEDNSP